MNASIHSHSTSILTLTLTFIDSFIGIALLDRFVIIELIGQGEFSLIFSALDTHTDAHVAVKIDKPIDSNHDGDDAIASYIWEEKSIFQM